MPEQLMITCPHCAFSKVVPKNAIPADARQVTCPKCKQSFPLRENVQEFAAPQPEPAAPPPFAIDAEVTAPPQPPKPKPIPRNLSFAFNGSARDYFGIWIVNTLLKIVTVGIYSAWAKVRRRRFFYGSTTLERQPFEYLADPMTLFKGWLIAAVAFILYSIGTRVSPILSGIIAVIVAVAFPWLVVRSRIFNAVNSSYRNIRFGFRRNYREAYIVYLGLPILTGLTLGLLSPYAMYRQKKFLVENSTFGSTPFVFSATAKDFYILALKVIGGFVLVVGSVGIALWLTGFNVISAMFDHKPVGFPGLAYIPFLTFPILYFILGVYAQTAMQNLCWNATHLGSDSFRSTLRVRDMALLFVTNALAIFFTLGLMIPWATVRMVRYRFERLELQTANGLDGVVAAAGTDAGVGATGDEVGDLFDLPIEIAL